MTDRLLLPREEGVTGDAVGQRVGVVGGVCIAHTHTHTHTHRIIYAVLEYAQDEVAKYVIQSRV